jgi:hypothetical protein
MSDSGASPLHYRGAQEPVARPVEYLEIELGRGRRRWGFIAYVLFVLLVAAVFAALFVRFTGSLTVAIGVVGFMLIYMVSLGALASRNMRRTRDEFRR